MLGKPVPDFSAPSTGNTTFKLSGTRGSKVVLYFYPKDNTPGCTQQGSDFRDQYQAFSRAQCRVYGISRDSLQSHEGFKAKMKFPFELLSDEDETVCKLFDVIKMKNMYGKQVLGIQRSTFVIGRDGRIVREWRGVKVPGHAQEVLDFVRSARL